jgi:hypothetical protein
MIGLRLIIMAAFAQSGSLQRHLSHILQKRMGLARDSIMIVRKTSAMAIIGMPCVREAGSLVHAMATNHCKSSTNIRHSWAHSSVTTFPWHTHTQYSQ